MIKSVFILLLLSALTTEASGTKKTNIILPQRKPASIAPKKNATYYIGHNLTPSTDEIRAGSVTVGNYALGIAPADNLLIATSPWIWLSYNTTNLHLKYTKTVTPKSDIGIFVSYFDSYNSENLMSSNGSPGPSQFAPPQAGASNLPTAGELTVSTNRYQWTSYSAHALYGYHYENGNVQYLNLKYSYFLNDEMPYSLRMDPGLDSIRNQTDVSTLLKIPTSDNLSFALEAGALGLNYINPYAHLGASFCVHDNKWMLQVGASYTAPINELGTSSGLEIGRYDNRVHYSEIAKQYYTERYLQVAVHPEIQLQLFF